MLRQQRQNFLGEFRFATGPRPAHRLSQEITLISPAGNAQAGSSSWVDGRCLRLLRHVLDVLMRRLGETPGGLTITVCHPISRVTTQQVSAS